MSAFDLTISSSAATELQQFAQGQRTALQTHLASAHSQPLLPSEYMGKRIVDLRQEPERDRAAAMPQVLAQFTDLLKPEAQKAFGPEITEAARVMIQSVSTALERRAKARACGWEEEIAIGQNGAKEATLFQQKLFTSIFGEGLPKLLTKTTDTQTEMTALFETTKADPSPIARARMFSHILERKVYEKQPFSAQDRQCMLQLDMATMLATARCFDAVKKKQTRDIYNFFPPELTSSVIQVIKEYLTKDNIHAFLAVQQATLKEKTTLNISGYALDFLALKQIAEECPLLTTLDVTGSTICGVACFDENAIRYLFAKQPNLVIIGAACPVPQNTLFKEMMDNQILLDLSEYEALEIYVRMHELDHVLFDEPHNSVPIETLRQLKGDASLGALPEGTVALAKRT